MFLEKHVNITAMKLQSFQPTPMKKYVSAVALVVKINLFPPIEQSLQLS